MDIQSIIRRLAQYEPHCFVVSNPHISSVHLLPPDSAAIDSTELCIVSSLDFAFPEEGIYNLVLVGDAPSKFERAKYPGLNLIVLSGVEQEAILAVLQELVAHESLREPKELLFDALIQEEGLDRIIETASEIIGNPLVLCDLNFKTLGYTKGYSISNKYWDEVLNTGFQSMELVSILKTHDVMKSVYTRTKPYLVPKELGLSNAALMSMPVRVCGKVVASLGLMEFRKPFGPGDEPMLELIARTIAVELQKNNYYFFQKDVRFESFLKDLLDGSVRSKALIGEQMKGLDWDAQQYFHVLVISVDQLGKIDDLLVYFRNQMDGAFGSSKSVVYEERIVTIIDGKYQFFPDSESLAHFSDFLQKSDFYAGISRGFTDLSETSTYYRQAVNALDVGTRFRKRFRCNSYDDVVVYHFLDMCSVSANIESLCNPSLLVLLEYDKQHGTEFCKTLYAYVACFTNRPDAAESLAIHYNTLKYRLAKIHELTGIDINNKSSIRNLDLSFKVLNYLGMTGQEDIG